MRLFLIIIIIVAIMPGCRNSPEIPKGIISFEKMQDILWDLLSAESWARQTSNKDTTVIFSDEVKSLSDKTLKLHGTTEAEFNRSYEWYTNHSEIFLEVVDSLEVRKKREDSIRLAELHVAGGVTEQKENGRVLQPVKGVNELKRTKRTN